jgi:methyltransferase
MMSPLTTTRWLYLAVLALVVAERLFELRLSRRNERRARALGAVEAGAEHFRFMAALHAAFLVSCAAEVVLLERPFVPVVSALAGFALLATMGLRYCAVSSLGDRWNTRVLVLPGVPPVTVGPYRLLRHPNYLAVVVEVAALPMLHTAWLTATLFTVLDAWMLRVRIEVEEGALRQAQDAAHEAAAPAGAAR